MPGAPIFRFRTFPLIVVIALISATADAQQASDARRWTPSAISTPGYESSPAFTPDGREMYFLRADANFSAFRIMVSRCDGGQWTAAGAPSFAQPLPVIEADPFVTYDGKRLYYISSRQDPKHEDFDIWFVDRTDTGAWSEPQRLPEPVNSTASELLPRLDLQGRLYFGSAREGGLGQGDIYVAKQDAQGKWQVDNLGAPVNTPAFEYEAEISRDGSTMIVVAHRTERSHLYRYKWRNDRWVDVGQVPAIEEHFQVGPLLSADGGRLLFAQRDGERSGEIFLIDLAATADKAWPPDCR